MWKEYFKDLLGNFPKVKNWPISEIINSQPGIKLGQFEKEQLNEVLRKIKNRKAAELDERLKEVWKTRKFDDLLLIFCNAVNKQNTKKSWIKVCVLPYPKKVDLGITKKLRNIIHSSIVAKVYDALLRNHIEPEIEKVLRKKQNGFWRKRFTKWQILTIRRIIDGSRATNLQATLLFVDFSKDFDFIHIEKMEEILLAYGLHGNSSGHNDAL